MHGGAAGQRDRISPTHGGKQAAIEQGRVQLAGILEGETAVIEIAADFFALLGALAEQHGGALNYEAAVGAAIPVIKTLREGLAGTGIDRIYGILNGTCNYILTRMEQEGLSFDDCLKDAQRLGYAEADPAFDIEGHDTAQKLSILASLTFGVRVVGMLGVRTLVLAATVDRRQTLEILQLGGRGILLKDVVAERLAAACRSVTAGRYWLGDQTVTDIVQAMADPGGLQLPDPNGTTLTPRQLQIVKAVVEGRSNKDIAEKLGVSFRVGIERRLDGARDVGAHKTSMLQDLERGRTMEIDAEPMPAAEEPGADADDIAIVRGTLRAPWKWEELIVESAVIAGRDRADSQQTPCRYLHQNPPKGDCRPTRVNHALPPQGGQHFISLIFVRLPGSQQDSFGAGVAP